MRGAPAGKRIVFVGDLDAPPDAQSTHPWSRTDYGVAVAQASAGGAPLVLFLRNDTLFAQAFDMATLALTGEPLSPSWSRWPGSPNGAIGHFSVSKNRDAGLSIGHREQSPADLVQPPGRHRRPAGRACAVRHDEGVAGRQQGRRRPERSTASRTTRTCGSSISTSGASTRFTFDPGFDGQPVWSPDGRSVAWMSNRSKPDGPLSEGRRRIGHRRTARGAEKASPTSPTGRTTAS